MKTASVRALQESRVAKALRRCRHSAATLVVLLMVLASALPAGAQRSVPSGGSGNSGPTSGDWDSKWNLFRWRGKSAPQVQDRVNSDYARWIGKRWRNFEPSSDPNDRYVFDYPGDASLAYTPWGSEHKIEAVCYAMMIAVQMDDRDTFDRLWRFTKRFHQLGSNSDPRGFRALFGWFRLVNGDGTIGGWGDGGGGANPAPDGEQWIAASLYMASGRWGDSGAFNYRREADEIAYAMLHVQENNETANNGGLVNVFTDEDGTFKENQVRFVPFVNIDFTDPAYHLPGFYELFARYGPPGDRARWGRIASKSRRYLLPRNAGFDVDGLRPNNSGIYDNGTSHLPSNAAEFDGKWRPYPGKGEDWHGYGAEAWRVPLNVGFDYMWWANGSAEFAHHTPMTRGVQNTLGAAGGGWNAELNRFPYESYRNLNGVAFYQGANENFYGDHGLGPVGPNAVASLCSDSGYAGNFVDELWARSYNVGDRYATYLYMTSILMCSGNFRVYPPSDSSSGQLAFQIDSSGIPTSPVAPGTALSINGYFRVTSGSFSNGKIGLRIYGPNNVEVGSPTVDPVNLGVGQSAGVTWNASAPSTPGEYNVYGCAWNSDWSNASPFTYLGKFFVSNGDPTDLNAQ